MGSHHSRSTVLRAISWTCGNTHMNSRHSESGYNSALWRDDCLPHCGRESSKWHTAYITVPLNLLMDWRAGG